jgi:hypothetical protein
MDYAEIDKMFTYHPPKPGQPEQYVRLREAAKQFAYVINEECPEVDLKQQALMQLLNANMLANASIALNGHASVETNVRKVDILTFVNGPAEWKRVESLLVVKKHTRFRMFEDDGTPVDEGKEFIALSDGYMRHGVPSIDIE